jgi:hypothetical protein
MRPAVIADDATAPKGLGRVFESLRGRLHAPDPSGGQDDAIHEKLSNGRAADMEPTTSGRPEECSLRTQHSRLDGGGGGGHGFAPLEYGAQEEMILYRRARMQLMLWRCLTYCMFVALVGE